MTRNDFLNMIEASAPVDHRMVGAVYELIDIFPYFQSAHMLLLKGLHNNNDVKFENQLRQSAIHIADREALYYLLKTNTTLTDASAASEQVNTSEENRVSDNMQTVIESAKNSNQFISEIEKDSRENTTNEIQDTDNHLPAHSILISAESVDDNTSGVMLLLDEETSSSDDNIFYMDPGFSVPDYSDLLELDIDESNTTMPQNNTMRQEHIESKELDSEKQLQSELIDKFIINNPRIEPVRERTELSAEDFSKFNTDETGGFVTETLAKIYVNQGYYSKAIDIYEKLSLKFPEKSSYFASQIENVKEFIKK